VNHGLPGSVCFFAGAEPAEPAATRGDAMSADDAGAAEGRVGGGEEGGCGDDAVESVRWSARWITEQAEDVFLGEEAAFERFAAEVRGKALVIEPWAGASIDHYNDDVPKGGERTAQYVFVLDALNFCFWPSKTGLEYHDLAGGLSAALRRDAHALDAERLARVTADEVQGWFGAAHDVPSLAERVSRVRELGSVLARRWGGLAANLVRASGGSAPELVRLVAAELPGFRDEATFAGRKVAFLKRAQILVADLWAAFGCHTRDGEDGGSLSLSLGALRGMDRLTMFPDYRVPQTLRAFGLMRVSDSLAARIERGEEIAAGSREEMELRAVTIQAVEKARAALGGAWKAVEVDWWMWQNGEARKAEYPPFHRTRTCFY
jgi:Potential Queuosine, Q, salvage protein family